MTGSRGGCFTLCGLVVLFILSACFLMITESVGKDSGTLSGPEESEEVETESAETGKKDEDRTGEGAEPELAAKGA